MNGGGIVSMLRHKGRWGIVAMLRHKGRWGIMAMLRHKGRWCDSGHVKA